MEWKWAGTEPLAAIRLEDALWMSIVPFTPIGSQPDPLKEAPPGQARGKRDTRAAPQPMDRATRAGEEGTVP